MNHLLNILDGFASILENHLAPGRHYVRPRRACGFNEDQKRLRGDVARVGKDLKKSISAYGDQSSSRARYKP